MTGEMYWYFAAKDRKLRYGDNRIAKVSGGYVTTDDLCAHAQEWIDCELVALLRLNDRFLKGDMERMVARIRELEADNAQLLERCNNLSADAETELKAAEKRAEEAERVLRELVACKDLKDGGLDTIELQGEYQRRRTAAWIAARAAIAGEKP